MRGRSWFLAFVCSLAALALTSMGMLTRLAWADLINFGDSYGSIGGGELRASGLSSLIPSRTGTAFEGGIPAAPGSFETFSVEKFEVIDFGLSNDTAVLNTQTSAQDSNYAGGNHGGFNDPLDARTAYLYDHFINLNLTTPYDYVNAANRVNDANALQQAIWFLEQEDSTALTGKALAFFNEANNAVNGGSWAGLGGVRVLNISKDQASYQDVLIIATPAPVSVPSPTSAALVATGLLSLAALRRRNRCRVR